MNTDCNHDGDEIGDDQVQDLLDNEGCHIEVAGHPDSVIVIDTNDNDPVLTLLNEAAALYANMHPHDAYIEDMFDNLKQAIREEAEEEKE